MTVTIVEHGDFVAYTPANPLQVAAPGGLPMVVKYCRRVSDGADWYALAAGNSLTGKTLAATLALPDGRFLVGAVSNDAHRLFPAGGKLLEIVGYTGSDAQESFRAGLYDPATGLIAPAPVAPLRTYKADIWRRCSDHEAEQLADLLAQQAVRQQRIFNDAQHLDHSDELYLSLSDAVAQLLGRTRADAILAPSV